MGGTLPLTEIESAVLELPRHHKYTLGSEIRANTLENFQIDHRAVSRQQNGTKVIQKRTELNNEQ